MPTRTRKIDWPRYDQALKRRGDLTVWFSDEAVAGWHPLPGGKRGGQKLYSDVAIETVLTLRLVYGGSLRRAEGFVESLLKLMGLDLRAPDHTTMSRRSKTLPVPQSRSSTDDTVHIIVDSTGVKIYGEGEWNSAKHGSKKRRRWRKLHLGIDASTLEIVAHTLTTDDVGDVTEVPALLAQLDQQVDELIGDGAYDSQSVYDAVAGARSRRGGRVTVPPRRNAVLSLQVHSQPTARDRHVLVMGAIGRRGWEEYVAYQRRLLVENAMYRYKTLIGCRLRSRELDAQKTEAAIGCSILNTMARIGLTRSAIAA